MKMKDAEITLLAELLEKFVDHTFVEGGPRTLRAVKEIRDFRPTFPEPKPFVQPAAVLAVLDAAAVDDDRFDKQDIEELRWEFGARVRALHNRTQRYNDEGDFAGLQLAQESAAATGAVVLLMLQAFHDDADAMATLAAGGITVQEVQS